MSSSTTASDLSVTVNGQTRIVPTGLTVTGLLEMLEVTTRHVAVELNGQVVPRSAHATRSLASGDQLEIVTLVGGG
jgi:sulfur carrier protein